MTKTYRQPGNVLDYTNTSGSTILAGKVVRIGNVLGVTLVDIANNATGSVMIDGVHVLPKVSGAVIAQGESLSWDASAAAFDDNLATPATGDVTGPPALAFEAAGNGVTSLAVKLTGVPGTVT